MTRTRILAGPILLAAVLLLVAGCDEKTKLQREIEVEKDAVAFHRQVKSGGYDVITCEELHDLIEAKTPMVLVDAGKSKRTFEEQHIPGAKYFFFDFEDHEDWDEKLANGLSEEDYRKVLGGDTDKLIVIYSGYTKCRRSHNAAKFARRMGYTSVKRFAGGLYAWKGSDYPVEAVEEKVAE